jgi:large repetitive protein
VLQPEPATVSGTVTDSVSGDGVEGVTVVLSDDDGEVDTATTDADGVYTIGGLTQGDYDVTFSAPNYEGATGAASVGPGGTDTVDAALVPFGSIVGEVVETATGEPIANLGIRVLSGGAPVQGVSVDTATATFAASVPAGSYVIEVLSAGMLVATRSVSVAPAQQLVETFALNLGIVTGQVTDADNGSPIADALVTFTRSVGGQSGTVTTDAAGNYRIDVQPGGYAITVSATGFESENIPTQSFGTDGGTQDVQLDPSPGSLTGVVVVAANNAPISGASVVLQDGGSTVASTTSAADGSFSLTGIDRGTYTLVIDAGTGYDVRTVNNVVVTQGQNNALGNLTVVAQPASLTGTVTSGGDPVQGAQVALLNADGNVVGATVTTNAAGEYTRNNIVTGEYTVRVTASGFVTQTATQSFAPGQAVTRNFTLTPTGTLPVTVVDQDGAPISATVSLVTGGSTVASFTGASGNLTAGVGSYTVTAERDGYDGDSEAVTLVAGTNDAVELTIVAQPTTIQGVVRDGVANTPVEGATVTLEGDPIAPEDPEDDPIPNVVTTTSAADGSYSFTGVDAGTYTVTAAIDGYGPVSAEVTTTPGATVTQNLVFNWTVQVTVRDAVTGETVPGQDVEVRDGEDTSIATTDSTGRTRLSLAPGSYTLFTQVEDRAPITRQITVNPGVAQSITLTAQLPSSVSGVVRSSFEDTILEDATVTLLQGGTEFGTVTTTEDGTYEFEGLAAGVYQLAADAEQHEAQTFSVTIPAARDITRDLVLEATPVTVSGTVTDFDSEEPIEGASVTFVRQSNGQPLTGQVVTDEDGTYSRALPVDTYTVLFDADGYDQAEGEIVSSFDVDEFQTLDVAMELETALFGVITGGLDELPVQGANVEVVDEAGNVLYSAVTAADGSYRVLATRGEALVRLSRAGFITTTETVETQPRTENPFSFNMVAGISTGEVTLNGLGGRLGLGEESEPFEFPEGVTMVGNIADDGTLTVARNRISFPEIRESVDADGIPVNAVLSVLALSDATGFVDVETGHIDLDLDIGIRIRGTATVVITVSFGGPNCGTGWGDARGPAIELRGTTGQSGAFTGSPVDLATREFTLVDNELTVGAVSGCGSLVGNDVDALLNGLLGIEPGGRTEPGAVFIELDFQLN